MQLAWVTILLWGLFGRAELPRILPVSAPAPAGEREAWRPLAESLAAADLAAQQAWLERGPLAEVLRAGRPAHDAQRAEIERQVGAASAKLAAGKSLSAEEFEALLSVFGQLEQAALERLAREYRIATYNAFRGDRAEFDRRRQAWEDVQSAWRLAGSRPEHRRMLISWLRAATAATQEGRGVVLPAAPHFTTALDAPGLAGGGAPAAAPSIERSAGPVAVDVPASKAAGRLDRQPSRHPAKRQAPTRDAQPLGPAPLEPATTARRPALEPRAGDEPRRVAARRPVTAPEPEGAAPVPPLAVETGSNDTGPSGVASREPEPAALPSSRSPTAPAAAPLTQVEARPGPRSAHRPSPRRRARSPQPNISTADVRRSPVPAAELRIASAPDHPLANVAGEPADVRPVQINLEELSVRIVGFNFALAALEAHLAERTHWTAAQLEPLVQQLGELGQLRSMLAGYRQFVVETAPVRLGQLEPLGPAVTSLAARISSARTALVNAASADMGPAEAAELSRLDALSRRLAHLAAEEPR